MTVNYKCPTYVKLIDGQATAIVLCDDNGPFLRTFLYQAGTVTTEDTELDGTPYAVVGTPVDCGDTVIPSEVNPANLIPNGVDDRLQVTNVVTATTGIPVLVADSTHVKWRLEGGSVRVTVDGSDPIGDVDPAVGNGTMMYNGDGDVWTVEEWAASRWVRNTGTDGWIHVSQYIPVV